MSSTANLAALTRNLAMFTTKLATCRIRSFLNFFLTRLLSTIIPILWLLIDCILSNLLSCQLWQWKNDFRLQKKDYSIYIFGIQVFEQIRLIQDKIYITKEGGKRVKGSYIKKYLDKNLQKQSIMLMVYCERFQNVSKSYNQWYIEFYWKVVS